MERFLHHHLEELHSQTDMKNLIDSLSQRMATHQSRVHQIVYSEPLENIEVILWIILGVVADQHRGEQLLFWHFGGTVRETQLHCTWREEPSHLSQRGCGPIMGICCARCCPEDREEAGEA